MTRPLRATLGTEHTTAQATNLNTSITSPARIRINVSYVHDNSMATEKQTKLRALVLKAKAKYAQRKEGKTVRKRAGALMSDAKDLDIDIQQALLEARKLVKTANQMPRPDTPPPRDPLFKRPQDAPLSEYEKRVKTYNAIVDDYEKMQGKLRLLQEKVSTFHEEVKQLRASYTPAKQITKDEHSIEGLENAGANLDVAMLKLAAEVGEARRAAV